MATHPSIAAQRIPWTEEPGELQSSRLQSQTQLRDQNTTDFIYTMSFYSHKISGLSFFIILIFLLKMRILKKDCLAFLLGYWQHKGVKPFGNSKSIYKYHFLIFPLSVGRMRDLLACFQRQFIPFVKAIHCVSPCRTFYIFLTHSDFC